MVARRCFGWWFAGIVTVAWSVPAAALLPAGCSEADNALAAQYTDRALQALVNDSTERFITLTHQMETGLSKPCRTALDREQPARTRCSSSERDLAVKLYRKIISSALAGNLDMTFLAFAELEESVSVDCWLALNQSDKPRVRASCSAAELDLMAAHAGPAMKATRWMLATNDPSPMLQVLQSMASGVSPMCWSAVNAAAAQPQPQQKKHSTPMDLPRVFDHGGGTFSAPGLGACGPSGCMAF